MTKIEQSVCEKIEHRANVGLAKYGTGMDRKDFTTLQWLRHAQEEATDLAVYLEKLIQDEETRNRITRGGADEPFEER